MSARGGGPNAHPSREALHESELRRDRVVQQISGFADAAAAAQEARTTEGIFSIARERLQALGLSVVFSEIRGDSFLYVHVDSALKKVAEAFSALAQGPMPIAQAPVQLAIRNHPHGVLVEDLRSIAAQALHIARAEADIPDGMCAVGAAIHVGGVVVFHALAAGIDLDRSIAPAFGLFARQLGTAIETARRIEELGRSNRELTTINHVARAAATLGSGRALEAALEELAHSLEIDGIALFRCEDSHLVLSVHLGMPEAWVASSSRILLSSPTPWSLAIHLAGPTRFALRAGQDAVAIGLRAGELLQGVLIASRTPRPLLGDELRLLNTVSAQLAISLHNALLLQQTQRRVRELSLLLELGQAVAGKFDQGEILREGVRVAARVLRCSAAYIFVPDTAEGSLGCAAREDPLWPPESSSRMPLDRPSLTAAAFKSGKAQSSDNTENDQRIDPELNARFGSRSVLVVPLRSRAETMGVLLLIERSSDRHFDEQDMRLAVHAAQLLAASMENAALYDEQHRRADEMTQLNEVTRSLVGSFELEPLLSKASETLRQVLDATHVLVYLLDEKKTGLVVWSAPAEFPQFRGLRLSLDQPSSSAQAVRSRHTVQIRDVPASPFVAREWATMLGSQTILAVPLIARDELVGTIVLSDVRKERVFSSSEEDRAAVVAGQIAMALITARLIEDLRRSYSELKRTQSELVDRERLAALGELSASIAHEVRNPLGVIFNALGSLRRLLRLVRQEGNVEMLLGIIGEEAERLNRMVGDLLDYSRPYNPALQAVPLEALVAESLAAARSQEMRRPDDSPINQEGMRIDVQIPPGLTLRADPRLLRQALINLFLNSFQAMPKGGRLEIVAERQRDANGMQARLCIRDNGPGIPESVRPRVFHPFFTTKATGTGLGLAVVKRIIEGHGGRIGVRDSEVPGAGAEFELWLPTEDQESK